MVRNKVDTCIFCGEAPCSCNTPSNTATPKKRVNLDKPDKADKSDIPDLASSRDRKKLFAAAMRAKAAEAPPPVSPPPRPPYAGGKLQHRKVKLEDALFEAAVRALGPLLAPQERDKYKAILTSEPTLEEKQVVWKARRDERHKQHGEGPTVD